MPVNVLSSLQMTAEAMGRKMGIKITVGGNQAYTNGKTINIPTLPDTEDGNILSRGFIDHEAAHIAITNFDVPATLWGNIIEDIRIEVERSLLYPGIKKNIQLLIDLLIERGEYLEWDAKQPKTLLAAWVSERGRVNAGYSNLRKRADKAERKAKAIFGKEFTERIQDIIDRIPLCQSTQDACDLGQEIEKTIQDFQGEGSVSDSSESGAGEGSVSDSSESGAGEGSVSDSSESGAGEGSDSDGSDSGADEGSVSGGSDSGAGKGSGSDGSDSGAGEGSGSGGSDSDSSESGAGKGSGSNPKLKAFANDPDPTNVDIGQHIAQNIETLSADSAHTLDTIDCPEDVNFSLDLREVSNIPPVGGMVAQIRGLLQAQKMRYYAETVAGQRLSLYAPCKIACRTPDTRMFQKKELKKGLDTAVAILLDTSGSMIYNDALGIASSGCYVAARAMDMNNIPCFVGTFPYFSTLKTFDSRTSREMLGESNGSTPIAEALVWVSEKIIARKEQRKIVIVITDGEPDNPQLAEEAVARMNTRGIEVYAIGIGPSGDDLNTWFKDQNRQRIISNIRDFPKALLEVLRDGLTKHF